MLHHQVRNQRRSRLCRAVQTCSGLGALIITASALAGTPAVVFGPPVIVNQSMGVARIAVADFNLDGQTDLAIIDGGINILTIISGGGGVLVDSLIALGGQPFDPRIAAADLNNDTLPDMVAVCGDIDYQTYIQQPGGIFKRVSTGIPGEFYIPQFALGHMNQGNAIDLITANPSGVHLNDGGGQFVTVGRISPTPIFSRIHAANMNGDALGDLLRVTGGLPSTVQVMRNDGAGALALSAEYTVPSNARSAVGDFNADGVSDIAMIDFAPRNSIEVRLGQPNATLGAPLSFSTGPYPSTIAAGDVNGDGRDDIIVSMSAVNGIAEVRVYLLAPKGGFVLGGSGPIPVDDSGGGGAHILDMVVADLTNDGRADLAVASVGFGLVLVPNITPVPTPIGDINGDGVVDLDDLLAVINAWGPCPVPPPPCLADIDANGTVNIDDLLAVITHWG